MKDVTEPKLVRPKVNKILKTTLLFTILNAALSAFLAYDFYAEGANQVCSTEGLLGCGGITQSQYATLGGIPHVIIGFIFYMLIFIGIGGVLLRFPFHKILKFLRPQTVLNYARWASYGAALFAFYLSYAEISIDGIVSIPYLVQQLMIFVVLGLQIWANTVISEGKKETQVCEFC